MFPAGYNSPEALYMLTPQIIQIIGVEKSIHHKFPWSSCKNSLFVLCPGLTINLVDNLGPPLRLNRYDFKVIQS